MSLSAAIRHMPIFKRYARRPEITVGEAMSAPAITVPADSTLQNMSEVMWDKKIGSLIVVDEQVRIAGIITERDVIYCAAKKLFDKKDVRIDSIMSKNAITVGPGDSLHSAIEKMRSHNVRHLPVVDLAGKPLGVLALRDILDLALGLLGIYAPSDLN